MLEFTGGLRVIKLDEKRYTATLNKIMGQIIREAAREWLRAVLLSVPERGGFPVLTGAAKSTLAPLGRFLRVAIGDRTPKGKRDRREEGEAKQEFLIIDDTNQVDWVFRFAWNTTLVHYIINEFHGLIKYAPWFSTVKGGIAFQNYVQLVLERRLPNIQDYIYEEYTNG